MTYGNILGISSSNALNADKKGVNSEIQFGLTHFLKQEMDQSIKYKLSGSSSAAIYNLLSCRKYEVKQ